MLYSAHNLYYVKLYVGIYRGKQELVSVVFYLMAEPQCGNFYFIVIDDR